MSKKGLIKCPHCKEEFNADEILQEHLDRVAEQEANLNEKENKLNKARAVFKEQEKRVSSLEKEKENLESAMKNAKSAALKEAKKDQDKKIADAIKNATLEEKKASKKREAEIEKKLKENAEKEALKTLNDRAKIIEKNAEKNAEKKLEEQKKSLVENAISKVKEESDISITKERKNFQLQINRQKEQIEKLHRQSKQGAVELQGEVQEEIIEDFLSKNFPDDNIEPIKKGARGADCIQYINDGNNFNVGQIIYESKDTQEFSEKWVDKLQDDMTKKNIGFGVIVTEAMPSKSIKLTETRLDGRITICKMSFSALHIVATKQRELIIRVNKLKNFKSHGDKPMQELWKLITNDQFALQLDKISSGFMKELELLEKDMRASSLSHKNRKKMIEQRQDVYRDMISSLSTIPGVLPNNMIEDKSGQDDDDEWEIHG